MRTSFQFVTLFVLVVSSADPAFQHIADPGQAFAIVKGPTFCNNCLSGMPEVTVSFRNPFNYTVTGIAMLIVSNSSSFVYSSTATISPAGGENQTAYLEITGLSYGTYSALVFLVTPNFGSLSAPATFWFTTFQSQGSEGPLTLVNMTQPFLCDCWAATYRNRAPSNITAIVVASVQNDIGQTLGIETVTINPPGGGNATAYFRVYGFILPGFQYCMDVFATSFGGGSLSMPDSVCFVGY